MTVDLGDVAGCTTPLSEPTGVGRGEWDEDVTGIEVTK